MITRNNLTFCFDDLSKQEIDAAMESNCDYILMQLLVANAGASCSIQAMDYNEETEAEAVDNGHLFLDKDIFLLLFHESGSKNEHFKDWI